MRDELKKRAAERAIEFVKDGQVVGLGTGSTTVFVIEGLGQLVKQGLRITGVPTSISSERLARDLQIPIADLNEVPAVDLDIDGADEIDSDFQMIKGGGGALTREKLVAVAAKQTVIVADQAKLVQTLGQSWPVPVEVLPFAWRLSTQYLSQLGCQPQLRLKAGNAFVTDNGNFIIDCNFGEIPDPASLEKNIKQAPGVVESGLFIGLADILVVGLDEGVEIRHRRA